MTAAERRESFAPGRLWSLWELMINYKILHLCKILEDLQRLQVDYDMRILHVNAEIQFGGGWRAVVEGSIPHEVADTDKSTLLAFLKLGEDQAVFLHLKGAKDRISRFRTRIQCEDISIHDVATEIRVLRETFESDLYEVCFHAYDPEKVKPLREAEIGWAVFFKKFPEFQDDIASSLDCYALGHNKASIFCLMKVMEKCVQLFGKKLRVDPIKLNPGKKVLELTWQDILNEINTKLKQMPLDTVLKKRRHEKCSAVQSYLYAVKDAWRNPTMHPRKQGYSDLQTLDIINHVKSFLIGFSGLV